MLDRDRGSRWRSARIIGFASVAAIALAGTTIVATATFFAAPASVNGAMTAAMSTAVPAPLHGAPVASQDTPAQQPEEISRSPLYRWLDEHRDAAYWAAPLLMVVVAILPIPAEIPAAMNGMLFGAVLGVLITWGGAMIGATISYELARYFGAGLTRRLIKPEAMAKVEGLRNTEAAVLLTLRLMPVVAFTLINWACGLLGIRRSTFLWTTAVGILPAAIAFTISGSAMAVLYERYPGTVTAVALGFLALIIARAWRKQPRAASEAVSSSGS